MEEEIIAYSDCLDVQSDHGTDTMLVAGSNKYDYAGISFNNFDKTFYIRVECRFFKQRRTTQNESEGLSDESVIKLGMESKRQKRLDVELAPFFFHDQMILILGMNKVTIEEDGEDVDWETEESYEMEEANDRSPFYIAKVFLTKKDDEFFTNVFGAP